MDKRYTILSALLFMSLLSFVGCTLLAPSQPQVAPEAANWQTWVLTASDELRPAAPPDEAATQAEIAELKALMAQRDAAAFESVAYWDAGSPAYRWVQLADERQKSLPPGPLHGRTMSLITVAMYDALIAAWDAKYTYNRPRPSALDATLTTLVTPPNSPAYPSAHAVVAGAASTVMAYLWPEEAEQYRAMAEEAAQSRLLAGVQYPSDVEVGLALGRAVGEKLVERAQNDGADAVWDGAMPEGAGHFTWRGNGPAIPMAGTWQTW